MLDTVAEGFKTHKFCTVASLVSCWFDSRTQHLSLLFMILVLLVFFSLLSLVSFFLFLSLIFFSDSILYAFSWLCTYISNLQILSLLLLFLLFSSTFFVISSLQAFDFTLLFQLFLHSLWLCSFCKKMWCESWTESNLTLVCINYLNA